MNGIFELELIESGRDNLDIDSGASFCRSLDEVRAFYESLGKRQLGSVDAYVESGDLLLSYDALAEALLAYGEAIKKDAHNSVALRKRGDVLFRMALSSDVDEDVRSYAIDASRDFQAALQLGCAFDEVAWSLGMALLLVEDFQGVSALVQKTLNGRRLLSKSSRRDLLYLLGFGRLFAGDLAGAGEAFDAMERDDGDSRVDSVDSGLDGVFGKLVVALVSGDRGEMLSMSDRLSIEDRALWRAGECLKISGCRSFLSVIRAILVGQVELAES